MKWIIWWLGLVAVIAAWYLTPYYVVELIGTTTSEEAGQYGDTYGVANSLFSAVTLMLVLAGLMHQREEIKALKEEQKDNRIRASLELWPWPQLNILSGPKLTDSRRIYNVMLANHGHIAADFVIASSEGGGKVCWGVVADIEAFDQPRDLVSKEEITLKILSPDQQDQMKFTFRFKTLAGEAGKVIFTITEQGISRQMLFPWQNPEAFKV